jgi:phosphoserine phosphatase RsbU/P
MCPGIPDSGGPAVKDRGEGVFVNEVPTVLIVDDAPVNVKMLDAIFRKEGFRTLLAASGPEGRTLARSARPDLILLDIMMPEESGFDTCLKLKRDSETTDIPVIFLSAMDDMKSKVHGLSIGAVDYVTKPFEKAEVLARARIHIKLNMAYRALVADQGGKLKEIHDAQQAILTRPEDVPDARCAVYYRSFQEAGGDFYDICPIAEGIYGYFVADVSGHDIRASFFTSALKAMIRQNATPIYTPKDTIKMMNAVLPSLLRDGQHVTACYAHLNRLRKRLTLISAGHPAVVFVSRDGRTELLKPAGDVLGAFDAVSLEAEERDVASGDRFFLYTDGLIEGFGDSRKMRNAGIDILVSACGRAAALSLDEALPAVVGTVFPDGVPQQDDLVLLGVEV